MSLMDKIKEFFSGGSTAGEHDHDHAGHDHADHDHAGHDHSTHGHESTAPPMPADPTGMSEPSPAPGTVTMPDTGQPGETDRRDDL